VLPAERDGRRTSLLMLLCSYGCVLCTSAQTTVVLIWIVLLQVVDQITMQLYEQTMDAQEGVVYFLLEEMEQQRIKENLLAYALLLIRGEQSCLIPARGYATPGVLQGLMRLTLLSLAGPKVGREDRRGHHQGDCIM